MCLPALVIAILGEDCVERCYPAASLPESGAYRFEGGSVLLLARRKRCNHLRRKHRTRIVDTPLDQAIERIGERLGVVDGVGRVVSLVSLGHHARSSMSLKSIPRGGRAMRTRRPSHVQRRAHLLAAASPGSSPSARMITSRTC